MGRDLARLFADPFVDASRRVSSALPPISAAFLLLLAGMLAARAIRTMLEAALSFIKLDHYTSRCGLNELFARLGLGRSPSAVIAFVAYWFVGVVFIVSAANALNMPVVSDLLERFAAFLPSLVGAVLTLFGGLLFGRLLSRVLVNAADANSIRGGRLLAASSYAIVMCYSAVAALDQLGAKPQLVLSAAQILIGSLGLALAIAFGFGAKDLAAEALHDILRKKS